MKTAKNNKATARSSISQLLSEITRRITQGLHPKKVILFGSYAYGTPTSDSDLDLLIIMESRDRPSERIRKVSDLFEPRPLPMDFVVLTPSELRRRLSGFDPFLEEILKKGRLLYGSAT